MSRRERAVPLSPPGELVDTLAMRTLSNVTAMDRVELAYEAAWVVEGALYLSALVLAAWLLYH